MKITSRTLLFLTATLTLILTLGETRLPMLFRVLASEVGLLMCLGGVWLTVKEYREQGFSPFRVAAAVFFVLLAIRFALGVLDGLGIWPH